jgi:WD40 repeat protein
MKNNFHAFNVSAFSVIMNPLDSLSIVCISKTTVVQQQLTACLSYTIFKGSADCTVRLWDIRTLQLVAVFSGHAKAVISVTFEKSGKYIASG